MACTEGDPCNKGLQSVKIRDSGGPMRPETHMEETRGAEYSDGLVVDLFAHLENSTEAIQN
jgi:hypothetical protein